MFCGSWHLGSSVFLSKLHHRYHSALVCFDVGSATVLLFGQMVKLLLFFQFCLLVIKAGNFSHSFALVWPVLLVFFPSMVIAPSARCMACDDTKPCQVACFNACVAPLSLVHWLTISLWPNEFHLLIAYWAYPEITALGNAHWDTKGRGGEKNERASAGLGRNGRMKKFKRFFFLLLVVRADRMIAASVWNWNYIQEWYLYARM